MILELYEKIHMVLGEQFTFVCHLGEVMLNNWLIWWDVLEDKALKSIKNNRMPASTSQPRLVSTYAPRPRPKQLSIYTYDICDNTQSSHSKYVACQLLLSF